MISKVTLVKRLFYKFFISAYPHKYQSQPFWRSGATNHCSSIVLKGTRLTPDWTQLLCFIAHRSFNMIRSFFRRSCLAHVWPTFLYNDVCLGFQKSAVLLDDFISTGNDVWGTEKIPFSIGWTWYERNFASFVDKIYIETINSYVSNKMFYG